MGDNSYAEEQALSLKLFVVLSKAQKIMMDHATRDIRRHGISATEFSVLELLYNKGRIPLQQIGGRVLVTSGSITYNIDKLEKKGLLKREPCSEDRRVTYAVLTDEGAAWFDRIFPEHADVIHRASAGLTSEEKQAAVELLKKLGLEAQRQL